MSLILCEFVDDSTVMGRCIGCGVEVGLLDVGEVRHLLKNNLNLFCFECGRDGADRIHPELFSNEPQYLVKIDGQWFSVNWPNAARRGRQQIAHYQAITEDLYKRLEASLFLSSSVNLNADDLGLLLEQDGGGQ